MKMDGKASCLKRTEKFLGCALQNIKIGMKRRRRTEMSGRIHLGQCFLGCFEEIILHLL